MPAFSADNLVHSYRGLNATTGERAAGFLIGNDLFVFVVVTDSIVNLFLQLICGLVIQVFPREVFYRFSVGRLIEERIPVEKALVFG